MLECAYKRNIWIIWMIYAAEWGIDDNMLYVNRPEPPPQKLPLQILVCCLLPLTGLQVSPTARLLVITLLDLTCVPVPHELEHSDHSPYPDQISHKPLSLSAIDGECSSVHNMQDIFCGFVSVIFCIY